MRSHRRWRLVAIAVAGVVLGSPAGTASAQVFVDPDGPAGKQYSDSLDEARAKNSATDPSTAVPNSGQGSPPLFGEGVQPEARGDENTEGQDAQSGVGEGSAAAAASDDVGGGGGTPLLLMALVAGVVALGAVGGFAASRGIRGSEA